MRLTDAQSREFLQTHGVYVAEACDRCGQILGPVRYTRRGEKGVWCSRLCRDGTEHRAGVCRGCGTSLNGKRKGAIYCHRTCRMRTVRKEGQNHTNIVNTSLQGKGLTDATLRSSYGGSQTEISTLYRAGIRRQMKLESTAPSSTTYLKLTAKV
jgi:hypothetical protein